MSFLIKRKPCYVIVNERERGKESKLVNYCQSMGYNPIVRVYKTIEDIRYILFSPSLFPDDEKIRCAVFDSINDLGNITIQRSILEGLVNGNWKVYFYENPHLGGDCVKAYLEGLKHAPHSNPKLWEGYMKALRERRIGRKRIPLPIDKVREYLRAGLSRKDVYRLLLKEGYLKYKTKKGERTLSYNHFLRKLKKEGIE